MLTPTIQALTAASGNVGNVWEGNSPLKECMQTQTPLLKRGEEPVVVQFAFCPWRSLWAYWVSTMCQAQWDLAHSVFTAAEQSIVWWLRNLFNQEIWVLSSFLQTILQWISLHVFFCVPLQVILKDVDLWLHCVFWIWIIKLLSREVKLVYVSIRAYENCEAFIILQNAEGERRALWI